MKTRVQKQRYAHSTQKLDETKTQMLRDIGFKFRLLPPTENIWEQTYNELGEYFQCNGVNAPIPQKVNKGLYSWLLEASKSSYWTTLV